MNRETLCPPGVSSLPAGDLHPAVLQMDLLSAEGLRLGQLCAGKAQLDLEGARAHVLRMLRVVGPASGEDLVERLKRSGFIPHDDRAFGSVFGLLAKRGLIKCIGQCLRKRGHGTAGGRVWAASDVKTPEACDPGR
jgi:hypothetical protein